MERYVLNSGKVLEIDFTNIESILKIEKDEWLELREIWFFGITIRLLQSSKQEIIDFFINKINH